MTIEIIVPIRVGQKLNRIQLKRIKERHQEEKVVVVQRSQCWWKEVKSAENLRAEKVMMNLSEIMEGI